MSSYKSFTPLITAALWDLLPVSEGGGPVGGVCGGPSAILPWNQGAMDLVFLSKPAWRGSCSSLNQRTMTSLEMGRRGRSQVLQRRERERGRIRGEGTDGRREATVRTNKHSAHTHACGEDAMRVGYSKTLCRLECTSCDSRSPKNTVITCFEESHPGGGGKEDGRGIWGKEKAHFPSRMARCECERPRRRTLM